MAAIIIVEDGSGVVNANSYVTLIEAKTYAKNIGDETSFDDSDLATTALFKAMRYLNSISNWLGITSYTDQYLAWPRQNVYIDYVSFPSDSIPKILKQAQIELMLAVRQGIDLFPNSSGYSGSNIKKDKVGPLETEYFSPSDMGLVVGVITLPLVDALLDQLRAGYGQFAIVRA